MDWQPTGEIGYLRPKKQKRYLRMVVVTFFFFPPSSEWVTRSIHGNPCQWASFYEQEALSSSPEATSRVSWFLDGRGDRSPTSLFKSSFSLLLKNNLYWRRRKDQSVDGWPATEAASAGYVLFFFFIDKNHHEEVTLEKSLSASLGQWFWSGHVRSWYCAARWLGVMSQHVAWWSAAYSVDTREHVQ